MLINTNKKEIKTGTFTLRQIVHILSNNITIVLSSHLRRLSNRAIPPIAFPRCDQSQREANPNEISSASETCARRISVGSNRFERNKKKKERKRKRKRKIQNKAKKRWCGWITGSVFRSELEAKNRIARDQPRDTGCKQIERVLQQSADRRASLTLIGIAFGCSGCALNPETIGTPKPQELREQSSETTRRERGASNTFLMVTRTLNTYSARR